MRILFAAAGCLLAGVVGQSVADVSVVVDGPTPAAPVEVHVEAPPVLPPPPVYHAHAAPVAVAKPVECCPIAVLRELALPSAKHAYRCHGGPIHQTICVDNPADGCAKLYSVSVCVPACCTGPPVCCDAKVGLLGRGYAVYQWPCGFEAVITFRVHGGVLITYR
ncbi:MAG: hypothetical protein AAGJ46_15810 [Planctomycetota bacterium]